MTALVPHEPKAIAARPSFFAVEPKEQVKMATEMADVLADIIERQKLYSLIQGKKYVKVEGWQTLGTFLGVLPRERCVNRLSDGSFEAFVDLVKSSDGTIIGGGSALCSIQEKRWGGADDFARRSMAITRATGKAFRSAFSWIITLAGYEPTPEEEIPRPETKEVVAAKAPTEIYTGTPEQQKKVRAHCEKEGVGDEYWGAIHEALDGKQFNKIQVGLAIAKATGK